MQSARFALLFAGLAATLFSATAQSPQTLRRLKSRYAHVGKARDGRMAVSPAACGPKVGRFIVGAHFGYADTLGRIVIPVQFDYASDFANGLALVGVGKRDARKFGFIDTTGRVVVPIEYDDAEAPREGLLKVMRRNAAGDPLWGYLATTGEVVVPLEYGDLKKPAEGLIAAARGAWKTEEGSSKRVFMGRYGFLDREGREAIPFRYADAHSFQNGRAAVAVAGKYYPKWGFVDREGNEVVAPKYYEAGNFREERAVVARVVDGKLRYGFIDPDGDEVIALQYASAKDFRDGIALVSGFGETNAPFYLIDTAGTRQLPYALYDVNDSGRYGHMTAAVPDSAGVLRYGLIDRRGRRVIPFAYDRITIFSEWDAATQSWRERGIAERGDEEVSFDIARRKR